MKLNVTVEVLSATAVLGLPGSRLPRDTRSTIEKMPQAERETKFVLWVDNFPPRIIDCKAVSRYFPMLVERTFQEAIALLRDCDNVYMAGPGGLQVSWSKIQQTFLDGNGNDWVPSPALILSEEKRWYVYSKVKSDSSQTEFPNV